MSELVDKVIAEDPELAKKIDALVEKRIADMYARVKEIQKEIEKEATEEAAEEAAKKPKKPSTK